MRRGNAIDAWLATDLPPGRSRSDIGSPVPSQRGRRAMMRNLGKALTEKLHAMDDVRDVAGSPSPVPIAATVGEYQKVLTAATTSPSIHSPHSYSIERVGDMGRMEIEPVGISVSSPAAAVAAATASYCVLCISALVDALTRSEMFDIISRQTSRLKLLEVQRNSAERERDMLKDELNHLRSAHDKLLDHISSHGKFVKTRAMRNATGGEYSSRSHLNVHPSSITAKRSGSSTHRSGTPTSVSSRSRSHRDREAYYQLPR